MLKSPPPPPPPPPHPTPWLSGGAHVYFCHCVCYNFLYKFLHEYLKTCQSYSILWPVLQGHSIVRGKTASGMCWYCMHVRIYAALITDYSMNTDWLVILRHNTNKDYMAQQTRVTHTHTQSFLLSHSLSLSKYLSRAAGWICCQWLSCNFVTNFILLSTSL